MIKLEGFSNWNIWKLQTPLLQGQGWLQIIEGRSVKPGEIAGQTSWKSKDAKSQILLVKKCLKTLCYISKTSTKMWI